MKVNKFNNYSEKNKNFWKKQKFYKFYTPDTFLFRLISNKKIFIKKGAIVHGIDIKPKFINILKKKFNYKNFYLADLNAHFPKIKKKMSLIVCKDTFYYFEKENHIKIINYLRNLLFKKGYMILTFIEKEHKTNNKIINIKDLVNYKINYKYHERGNPIQFLPQNYVIKILKQCKFKIIENFFTVETHFKNGKNIIISKVLLLRKI